jgi:hypothetical protein
VKAHVKGDIVHKHLVNENSKEGTQYYETEGAYEVIGDVVAEAVVAVALVG